MTDAFAMMIGYIMGWFSIVAAHRMLRLKPIEPKIASEPESEPNVEKTAEQIEADRQFQQWLAQMDDMLKYDGKGGVKDGNKD